MSARALAPSSTPTTLPRTRAPRAPRAPRQHSPRPRPRRGRQLATVGAPAVATGGADDSEALAIPRRDLARERSRVRPTPLIPSPWLSASTVTNASHATSRSAAWPRIEPRNTREAFATILTSDDLLYFRSALVLAASIRIYDTSRPRDLAVQGLVPHAWYPVTQVQVEGTRGARAREVIGGTCAAVARAERTQPIRRCGGADEHQAAAVGADRI